MEAIIPATEARPLTNQEMDMVTGGTPFGPGGPFGGQFTSNFNFSQLFVQGDGSTLTAGNISIST